MLRVKYNVEARQTLLQDSYYIMEKVNILIKDYTIDYEEYYNRWHVGCDSYQDPFSWNIWDNGYCDQFSAYGNKNSVQVGAWQDRYEPYYCSSIASQNSPHLVLQDANVAVGSGCFSPVSLQVNPQGGYYQSYGQYNWQFWDMQQDADTITGIVRDDDDSNVWVWPESIWQTTGIQELYLIAQDQSKRFFMRRALIESGDWNGDEIVSGDTENRYSLQSLELKSFDAGNNHDLDASAWSWVYDSVLDTWACNYAAGFLCAGQSVWNLLYSGYKQPIDANDGRVNMFQKNVTINGRNVTIYPTKNPALSRGEEDVQINPYFTITLDTKLYGQVWYRKLGMDSLEKFSLRLQTSFNTKNFYTK